MVAAAFFAAGLAWWTLLEYLLHRFLFHALARWFGRRHLRHHARMRERRLAVAPWQTSAGGAALHVAVVLPLFGPAHGGALLAGLLLGYAAYEQVHLLCHYGHPRTRAGRWVQRWHLAHHREGDARFGVTSPFWDLVFRTAPPRRRAPRAVGAR